MYDDVVKGLHEAIDYEKGKRKDIRVDRVCVAQIPRFKGEKIKSIRMKQKMTQAVFSSVLGVSLKTVEAWESGRNVPNGPAQRMLYLLDKDDALLERYEIFTRQ
jgi:putative transcriptional regulator